MRPIDGARPDMETFAAARPLVTDAGYGDRRRRALAAMDLRAIDPPIVGLIGARPLARILKVPNPWLWAGILLFGRDVVTALTEDDQLTHLWVYRDSLSPIAELHPDGTLKSLFVYADQSHVPAYLIQIDPETGTERTYRYLTDHLGSPRLLVDIDSGAVKIQRQTDYGYDEVFARFWQR